MKKICIFVAVILLIMVLSFNATAETVNDNQENNESKEPHITVEAVKTDIEKLLKLTDEMSRLRVYIEFLYMEAGDYPATIEQLESDLNSILPRGLKHIEIPKDPATGKAFIYTRSEDKKSYTLRAPEPSAYGLDEVKISAVDWAGFAVVAEERKFRFLQTISVENIRALATALEFYAKDNGGKFPQELKQLIPNYLKSMPVCPVTGKFFEYQLNGNDYTIRSPGVKELRLNELMFSSKQGWVTR